MMRNRILVMLGASALPAQGPPDLAGPLTLADCLAEALDRSPAAASAEAAAAEAGETADSTRAAYYPNLEMDGGASRWQRHIFLPEHIGFPGTKIPSTVGPVDDYALSFVARYTLFDSGARKALLGAARSAADASVSRRDQARQDVALSVTRAFFDLESARGLRDVARESLARAKDHERIAEERKKAGAVPLVDVLRARVEVSNAELDGVRADGNLRVARGRLATAMGLPADTELSIVAEAGVAEAPDVKSVHADLNRAAQRRPSVLAAAAEVEAARRGVAQARSAFGPKLTASASYGWEDDSWLPSDRTWSVGVGVSLPIFTGFSRTHDLARSRQELARARADLDAARLAAREETWKAFSETEEAYEALQATDALVASAMESHRLAGERYRVGAGTLTDVLDAQTAFAQAEARRVSARAAYGVAKARYLWSLGDLAVERTGSRTAFDAGR
jgi:outer membrane protein